MVQDLILLLKKIVIGVIVALVPFFIYFAGLWLVRHIL